MFLIEKKPVLAIKSSIFEVPKVAFFQRGQPMLLVKKRPKANKRKKLIFSFLFYLEH